MPPPPAIPPARSDSLAPSGTGTIPARTTGGGGGGGAPVSGHWLPDGLRLERKRNAIDADDDEIQHPALPVEGGRSVSFPE